MKKVQFVSIGRVFPASDLTSTHALHSLDLSFSLQSAGVSIPASTALPSVRLQAILRWHRQRIPTIASIRFHFSPPLCQRAKTITARVSHPRPHRKTIHLQKRKTRHRTISSQQNRPSRLRRNTTLRRTIFTIIGCNLPSVQRLPVLHLVFPPQYT